jgi:hypothetical protein
MSFCTKCGSYIFRGNKCACIAFTVTDEDGEEHEIFASSDHEAALKYAEKSNVENDYYLLDESVGVAVNGKEFTISAEQDIQYSASEKL